MSELMELYQEVILDHGRRPRNFGPLEGATHHARGYNPLCGDNFTMHIALDGDTISDVRFEGEGCAISTASASLLTERLKGAHVDVVEPLFTAVHELVTGGEPSEDVELDKLEIFVGVGNFPMRVKCATLPWHTLRAALKGDEEATTE
ncbi:MAG: SUF system NifU family Fe-S cluster assembly protein [Proteobacteria bacterium]|nr:SUF system NifU family Fe-S cluster assembly protein [Pseudomonadota bacterium]